MLQEWPPVRRLAWTCTETAIQWRSCPPGRLSKRGDRYLRTLMIHGARAALRRIGGKQDPRSLWLSRMRERRHTNVVAVALANKNARIAWSLMSTDMPYDQARSTTAA